MVTYYLYRLHPNGRIASRDYVEADDDAKAESLAAELSHGDAAELWQGARLVRAFPGRSAK